MMDQEAIRPQSFPEQRHAQLSRQAPAALLTATALIAVYNLLAGPPGAHFIGSGLLLLFIEVLIPLAGAALVLLPAAQRRIELTLLLLDMLFTTVVQLELLLPNPDPAGVGLALGLKIAGTALVFPWAPAWQVAAAGYTLVAFIGGLHAGGIDLGTHSMVAPIIGALLSVAGSTIVHGHRRALYARQVELAESEDKYRSLAEGAVAGVLVYQDDQFRFVNQAFASMLGYTRDELIGQPNDRLHHREDLATVQQAIADLLGGQRGSFESTVRLLRRDGSEIFARASFGRIRYDGRPAALGVSIDVTSERAQQREAERLALILKDSEARYRDLFENATDLVFETDGEGYFVDANRAALTLAGYTKADLGHRIHITRLLPSEYPPEAIQGLRAALLAGQPVHQPYVITIVNAGGARRDVELHTRLIARPGCPAVFQSVGRDVTERQARLLESQRMVAFQRALTAVAASLHAPLGLDEIFAQVARVCHELFEVTAVRLWTVEGDTLVGRAGSGRGAAQIPNYRWPLAEPALPARAVQERRPLYVNHLQQSTWRDHPVARSGAQSWMSVPLLSGDEAIGVLALLDHDNPSRFDDQSIEWGRIFASQAVLAIENARLRDRERAEARTTTRLLELAQTLHGQLGDPHIHSILASESARILDSDIAAIVTYLADSGRLRVDHVHGLAPEQQAELTGLEFQAQPPVWFELGASQFSQEQAATPRVSALMRRWGVEHVLHLPIGRGESFLAMLVFARRTDRAFSADSVRLAEGIAYQAATTLENARLVNALQGANRLKSEFVATMSHELRSPLNVMMGYTDLLRDGQFGPVTPAQVETLSRVFQQADQLLQLINTTLDLSRLERGDVTLARDSFALSDLLHELAIEIAPRLSPSSPQLAWHAVNGMPPLHTDRGKLKLIIRNLVDNALKFTDAGIVEVTAARQNGRVEIRVRDTGTGIAADALETIFDMFRQVDANDHRSRGGVGLGLYIVRRLVTMLGGTVDVESRVGVGSTFCVTIPPDTAAA